MWLCEPTRPRNRFTTWKTTLGALREYAESVIQTNLLTLALMKLKHASKVPHDG